VCQKAALYFPGEGNAATGVHKEALQWPLLLELCHLLPAIHLHIVMVSPSLPDGLPQQGAWVGGPNMHCKVDGACS